MIYIYGITKSEKREVCGIGFDDRPVITIPHRDICAVTTALLDSRGVTIEDARIHERVLREIMNRFTIAPMAFGITLADETEVMNFLKQGYQVFEDTLQRLKDKTQVNITVSWDERILSEAMAEEEVRASLEKVKEAPQDVSLKVELGKKVKEVLGRREKKLLPEILVLKEHAIGFKENRLTNHDMILNLSLLLENKQQKRFKDVLTSLEKRFEGKLLFQAVLPLPPYSFVNISVKRSSFDELDKARRTLGLDVNITPAELQAAYEKMARLYHPDRNMGSLEKFNEIKKAYNALRDFTNFYSCPLSREEVEDKLIFSVN